MLALAAIAYAVVPLVDSLTLRWFVRDVEIRSNLIANTVQEPLEEMIRTGSRSRMLQFFTRISRDERLYAMGFCDSPASQPLATTTLPPEVTCASLEKFSGPLGRMLASAHGPLLVSVRPFQAEGAPAGNLVLLHDRGFVERRSEETRTYLFYFFIALSACRRRSSTT
jgi:trehalose 6-phosphate synthase